MIADNAKLAGSLSRVRLEMIEACGRFCQVCGLPRSLGQIYGLLYLAPSPLALNDIVAMLGISKASASTGTRQLAAWGGLRQVWVPGDRRDHFEAEPELGRLLRSGYSDLVKPRLIASQRRLDHMTETLSEDFAQGVVTSEEFKFYSDRLKRFATVHHTVQQVIPLTERLF